SHSLKKLDLLKRQQPSLSLSRSPLTRETELERKQSNLSLSLSHSQCWVLEPSRADHKFSPNLFVWASNLSNYFSFQAVCRSWRSVASEKHSYAGVSVAEFLG
ncbi:hypothetical protein GIB67_033463, partial [Kingdonia uniflora]